MVIVVSVVRLPEAISFVAVPPAPLKMRPTPLVGVLLKLELQTPEPPVHVEGKPSTVTARSPKFVPVPKLVRALLLIKLLAEELNTGDQLDPL